MACKSNAIELANIATAGSAAGTWQLSTLVPYGQDAKQGFMESCVVLHMSALAGSAPTIQFDVYEMVDNAWIHVGTTGAISSPDDRVIDSNSGAALSAGGTFTTGSNTGTLRLLGKGSDMKVVGTTTGPVGTIAFTVNVVLYDN